MRRRRARSQALVKVRGALGSIIALIPEQRSSTSVGTASRPSGQTGSMPPPPQEPSPLQVSVPDNWILEYHQVRPRSLLRSQLGYCPCALAAA